MFCHKCGKDIPEDSEFCLACGSKIVVDTEPTIAEVSNRSKKRKRVFMIIGAIVVALIVLLLFAVLMGFSVAKETARSVSANLSFIVNEYEKLKPYEGEYIYESEYMDATIILKPAGGAKMYVEASGVRLRSLDVGDFSFTFTYDDINKKLTCYEKDEYSEEYIKIEINLIDYNTIEVVREELPYSYGASFGGFSGYEYKKVR